MKVRHTIYINTKIIEFSLRESDINFNWFATTHLRNLFNYNCTINRIQLIPMTYCYPKSKGTIFFDENIIE